MLQHEIDRVGRGRGQKTEPAQGGGQYRNVGIAREFRGPARRCRRRPDPPPTRIRRLHWGPASTTSMPTPNARPSSGPRCSGPLSTASADNTRRLIPLAFNTFSTRRAVSVASARPVWTTRSNGAFTRHCGPASTARCTSAFQIVSCQTAIGLGAQPEEVFNVARWAWERARRDPDGVPTELVGAARDGKHRAAPAALNCGRRRRLPADLCPPRTAASPWERYPRRARRIQSARATLWSAR